MSVAKTTSEQNWKNYIIKAEQFLLTAQDTYFKKNWNSVGLTAVHAAISANDAIIVYRSEKRSVSKDHRDAISLLLKVHSGSEDVKNYSKHLSWLIDRKNLIEYESRLFYEREATDALKHAERFYNWAKSVLPR